MGAGVDQPLTHAKLRMPGLLGDQKVDNSRAVRDSLESIGCACVLHAVVCNDFEDVPGYLPVVDFVAVVFLVWSIYCSNYIQQVSMRSVLIAT